MTDVERKLWYALRAQRFASVKFRRQVPIGPYIVDFLCNAAKLVIELDGGQHNETEHRQRDEIRDVYLTNDGYRVLRFWNFEINSQFSACMDRIYLALIEQGLPLEASGIAADPSSGRWPPSPARGEGSYESGSYVSPSPLAGEGGQRPDEGFKSDTFYSPVSVQ